jgi:hypothetical protein
MIVNIRDFQLGPAFLELDISSVSNEFGVLKAQNSNLNPHYDIGGYMVCGISKRQLSFEIEALGKGGYPPF